VSCSVPRRQCSEGPERSPGERHGCVRIRDARVDHVCEWGRDGDDRRCDLRDRGSQTGSRTSWRSRPAMCVPSTGWSAVEKSDIGVRLLVALWTEAPAGPASDPTASARVE